MNEFDTTNFITFGTISLAVGGLSLAFGNATGFFLLLLVGLAFYGAAIRTARRKRNVPPAEKSPEKGKKEKGSKR